MTDSTLAKGSLEGTLETPRDHEALEAAQVYTHYLQGRLPEDDAQDFERHYADCTYCLEQLETTEALLDGLRRAAAEDAMQLDAGRRVAVAWYLRRRVAWTLAALGLVLAALGSWRQIDLQHRLETLQAPVTQPWGEPLTLTLAPLRGGTGEDIGDAAHRLHLPPEPTALHLTLPLALPPGGRYRVVLTTSEGALIWRLDGLGANADGELRLTVLSTVLDPGVVRLEVEALDADSGARQVALLRFDVQAPAPAGSLP